MATREELKSYFETNDIPTQEQFAELIDSMAILGEDNSGSVSAIIGQSWNNTQKALARANIGFDDALDDWVVTWDSIEAGALPLDRLPSVVGRKDQANTWALAQTFNGDVSIPNDGTYGGIAIRRASGRTGFLQMSKPDGTRQGYIGFDNGNDISFTNEQSGIFAFNKGATFNGNISQTNGTDTYQTSIGVPGNYDGYLRILRNGVLKALIGGDGADDLDFTVVSDLALLGATSKVRPFEHQNSWLEFKGSGKRNVELHAWDVLTLGTNFTTRLTIDADGNSTFNGNISAAGGIAVSGKIQISNNGSNFGSTLSNGSSQFYNSSTVGLVIAGAGSTSDLTVTNKAGGDVFSIPTGTTNVDFTGAVSALSLNADVGSDKPLRSYRGAAYSGWINGSAIYDQESWYMGGGSHYFAVGATNSLEVNATGINVTGNVTIPSNGVFRNDSGAKLVTGSNGSNPWTFLTGANGALGIKVGSLVVASAYYYTAPTNGLFVEGTATLNGVVNANSVGANIRLKADGSDALDGGVFANGLGTIYLSNWNADRGIRINADGSIATIGSGATTFNGNVNCDTATYPQFALKLSGVSKGILWYDSVNSRMTLGSGSTSNGMSLDASGNATFWGNTIVGSGTSSPIVRINGGSTIGIGASIEFQAAGSTIGYVGRASYVSSGGINTSDMAYYAHTGLGHNFIVNGGFSSAFSVTSAGNITATGTAKLGDYTVATLPSAVTYAGHECNVTDSSVTTFGSTVAGGGSSRVKLYSNGTNWTVQAV